MQAEFLILIEGHDETFAQLVHTNSSYNCSEILWDVRFSRMYHSRESHIVLELDKIHEVEDLISRGKDEEER